MPEAHKSTMKITRDGRPFTKDLHDLFSALIIQMPLDTHRVLFRSYPCTFTTDEAVANLGNLKFSHTLRSRKGLKESSVTTTTTTFSMTKDMAKALLTQFLDARLFVNASDSANLSLKDKGVWQVTPKGLCILEGFVDRSVVDGSHLNLLYAHVRPTKVIEIERASADDALVLTRSILTVILKTMMGFLPKESPGSSSSSLSNQSLSGKSKLEVEPKITPDHSFTGSLFADWINDYVTVVDLAEAEAIGNELMLYGWMEQIADEVDRRLEDTTVFKSTKYALYHLTKTGRNLLSGSSELNDMKSNMVANATIMARDKLAARTDKNRISSSDMSSDSVEEGEATLQEMLANDKLAIIAEKQRVKKTLLDSPRSMTRSGSGGSSPSGNSDMTSMHFANEIQQASKHGNVPPPAPMRQKHNSVGDRGRTIDLSTGRRLSSSNTDARSIASTNSISSLNEGDAHTMDGKDSNYTKLGQILEDPHLRQLFREHLKANFCEENICFWMDYHTMRRSIKGSISSRSVDQQKELLIEAYQIYSTYVAPGSSREVNIDHILRQEMDQFISSISTVVTSPFVNAPFQNSDTSTVILTTSNPANSLRMLIRMLDKVDDHVYRLMAQDSVPKFIRTEKDKEALSDLETSKRDSGNGSESSSQPATPPATLSDTLSDRKHKAEYSAMRSAVSPIIIRSE